MLKRFLVLFNNDKYRIVWAISKDRVRYVYEDVRSVFQMGVKHEQNSN